MNNWDSILQRGQNFYMYLNPTSNKFMFLPWDQDHSWGHFNAQFAPTGSIIKPWPERVRFLERMMAVPAFRQVYLARMREFSGTIFAPERFPPQLAELVAAIRPDVVKEPPSDPYRSGRPGSPTSRCSTSTRRALANRCRFQPRVQRTS
jgi:spore coat protein H